MRLNTLINKQMARWYPLKDHAVQLELIAAVQNGVRFPLVPAGRRSGKSERFKRFLVKEAFKNCGQYFAAAPTYGQAKKIFWQDLKDFCITNALKKKPSESDLIIYLDNGSEIHIIGLDKPERIEGIPWAGGGIDEFGDIKAGAWECNILPALNTVTPTNPDYRAWCWLLGVPNGFNHYYDLCQKAEANPIFKVFHWKSSEILPVDVIEQMRASMSVRDFKQEFEASFENKCDGIFKRQYFNNISQLPCELYDFSQIVQVWDMAFKGGANSDYVACVVGGLKDGKFWIIDYIKEKLSFNGSLEMVRNISAKYPQTRHNIHIEDKANGTAIIDTIRTQLNGYSVKEIKAIDSKIARANSIEPILVSGNLYINQAMGTNKINLLINDMIQFREGGGNDDLVDAVVHWLRLMKNSGSTSIWSY
jgi:predicted phage terminase large subunit-like protein